MFLQEVILPDWFAFGIMGFEFGMPILRTSVVI